MAKAVVPGQRLQCSGCGTELQVRAVGSGRMQCCGEALAEADAQSAANLTLGQSVHCDCGSEAAVLHDGGGNLCCCNKPMVHRRHPGV